MWKKSILISLVLGGAFFVFGFSGAEEVGCGQVKINEISSATTKDWVELYNVSDQDIDLSGWSAWDNGTNKKIFPTSTTISARGWVVISMSNWLNNGGDSVILKDINNQECERFDYGQDPPDGNWFWARIPDGGEWKKTATATPIAANIFEQISSEPNSANENTTQPNSGESASDIVIESPPQNLSAVKINEFVSNPEAGANEWVELYNTGSTNLDLAGAMICDNRNTTSTCKKLSGVIGPNSWLVADLQTRSFLNNDGDSVIFKDALGNVVDRIDYEDELVPDKGRSLARAADGVDTDNDSDWMVTDAPTPGEANVIKGKEAAALLDETGAASKAASVSSTADKESVEVEVIINEFLPNPKGDDNTGEFIEIKNNSSFQANLSGWFLKVKDKKYVFPADTVIFPGSLLIFYKPSTKLSLLNTGGTVELFDKNKDKIDSVSYEKPPEGKSYGLVRGEWEWANPTPGKDNKSEEVVANQEAEVKSASKKVYSFVNSIAAARQAPKGAPALVKGVVAVLPGVFGSQYFYLVDGDAGIQIYQNKKDFPELAVGDLVQVSGAVSQANGINRINVKNKDGFDILAIDQPVISAELNIDAIDESLAGGLVSIQGEITEIKSNLMYVDNGSAEIAVYFKQGAKIDKSRFAEGENARVTGILEQTKNGWQIWPRSNDDIESLGPSEDLLKKQAQASDGDVAEKYLTATAGGVTTLLLAFLARARGLLVLGGLKKVAGLAGKFIRKG